MYKRKQNLIKFFILLSEIFILCFINLIYVSLQYCLNQNFCFPNVIISKIRNNIRCHWSASCPPLKSKVFVTEKQSYTLRVERTGGYCIPSQRSCGQAVTWVPGREKGQRPPQLHPGWLRPETRHIFPIPSSQRFGCRGEEGGGVLSWKIYLILDHVMCIFVVSFKT